MVANVLNRPTLVLNRNWQPVGVTPVARALIKVWNGIAHVVDPVDYSVHSWIDWTALTVGYSDSCITTGSGKIRVPEVVTLTKYDRVPANAVTFSRRNVFKRDRFTCQYCGMQPGSEELTIDHVLPRAQGGISSWDNCVLACVECNKQKADRTPEQAGMPLRKQPGRPLWKPLYAAHNVRIDSWKKFLSEAFWNVELKE